MKMTRPFIGILALISLTSVSVMAAQPVVTNVRASQRAGTKLVDIYYDLTYAGTENLQSSVLVSTNGGASYSLPSTHFSGAGYGIYVTPGTGNHIIWDAGADWNGNFSTTVRFCITISEWRAIVIPH
jgi:hypothetical protein